MRTLAKTKTPRALAQMDAPRMAQGEMMTATQALLFALFFAIIGLLMVSAGFAGIVAAGG